MRTIVAAALLVTFMFAEATLLARQVFRSGVQTVFVDVVVTDGRTPLSGLSAASFTITDNEVPQQVEAASDAPIPLDISLVVDTSHRGVLYGTGANAGDSADLQRSVRQMAATLGNSERLRVLAFADDVVERRPLSPTDATTKDSISVAPTERLTNRYAITQALLTALAAPVPAERRHLVVLFALGSGKPTVSPVPHLSAAARRADALLFVVLPPPHREEITKRPFPFYPSEELIRQAVTQAAELTGGKAYLTSDIVGAFRDVLKEFRASYILRYTLQGVPSAGWHDIVVKVPSCPTCTIRARRGYMGR